MNSLIKAKSDCFTDVTPLLPGLRATRLIGFTMAGLLSLVAAPSYAQSAASETEEGTALILDMIMEEGESAEAAQASAVSSMQAAESLKISESEEVVDLSTLSPEERAQLTDTVGVWVNNAEPPAPPAELVEMVEPVEIKESSEQVVDAGELTPELVSQFPAMKTAPLPVAQEIKQAVAQPESTEKTTSTPTAPEKKVAVMTDSEETETAVKETEEKSTPRPVAMPRVTRWGGRPGGM